MTFHEVSKFYNLFRIVESGIMSKPGAIEIGWKKELLDDKVLDEKERSSRKDGKYQRLSSESSDSSSSSGTSSSNSSTSGEDVRKKKKQEKRERREKHKKDKLLKKEKKKLEKAQKKEMKKARREKRKEEKRLKKLAKKMKSKSEDDGDCSIPIDLMYTKALAPESKEEYEARQSQIRREVDPVTGRTRLIKGDGEILEEIVSREQHKEINKRATEGDGKFFQSKTVGWKFS